MPWRDGTGPWGYGPRTGRGLGPCGRGLARGFGRGFGWRARPAWFYDMPYQPTREQEIADLKAEKEMLRQELENIESRLRELEKGK